MDKINQVENKIEHVEQKIVNGVNVTKLVTQTACYKLAIGFHIQVTFSKIMFMVIEGILVQRSNFLMGATIQFL